jgi:hypothetical protein
MTHYRQKARDLVKQNSENVKKGIPNEIAFGSPKLESILYGVSQEVYYLVAGGTGSGKTKYVDYTFVLKPLAFVRRNPQTPIKVKVIYFSLEISGVMKAINLASFYIFGKYGISLSPSQILSKKYTLSEYEESLVDEGLEWVDDIAKDLTIYDDALTPAKMYGILKSYSEEHGKWDKNPVTKEETYTPNNPYLYTIVVVDHIGLIKVPDGGSKKAEIDKMSQYLIWFRNKCRFTPVLVSQFNRGMEGMDRIKHNALTPQLADLKETGNPAEDANVVLAMFSPLRFRLDEYRDYNIKKLNDRIRMISVLKNREGIAEKTLGLAFFGEVGFFYELPKGNEMTDDDYIKVLTYLEEWKKKKEEQRKRSLEDQ